LGALQARAGPVLVAMPVCFLRTLGGLIT